MTFNFMNPYYDSLFDIFLRAHTERINIDGKAITDALPNTDIQEIKEKYEAQKDSIDFNFKNFFESNFSYPSKISSDYKTDSSDDIETHIRKLWKVLSKSTQNIAPHSTLIPLPKPFIVPGGRFGEVYYWDTYFTIQGMKFHGLTDEIENLVDNFAYLIESVGFIPNGNRHYYLSRSQPPFFALMVETLAELKGEEVFQKYISAIEKEYAFFNQDFRNVTVGEHKASIYFDLNDSPRYEMYNDDLVLAKNVDDKTSFYRNIRAACESGWDFSSRWLSSANDLSTIKTLSIVPVDLNCLLYKIESICAKYSADAAKFELAAQKRAKLINELLWSDKAQSYMDYDLSRRQYTAVFSCAALYPLFMGVASQEKAETVAKMTEEKLLHAGGLASTNIQTHHQWDLPNGWAPLQWIAYKGLKKYGFDDLAQQIKSRWMRLNEKVFYSTGKLMEKYNVVDITLEAGGGEYDVQDGFGWTNGVYIAMKYDT